MTAFKEPRVSYLRALEYEIVRAIALKGRILDLGGGERAHYAPLMRVDGTLESLNFDASMRPTYVHDANTPFPIADATYDGLISLNTLEHIERDEFALSEAVRVLKPGAAFHIVVPFLYRVHGSPSDYHRHTCHWWEGALARSGVPPDSSRIEPMMWGRLCTAFAFLEFTRLRFLRKVPLYVDALIGNGSADAADYALGYYISGTKP